MSTRFQNYKELFDFANELRDTLAKKGKAKEAQELTELLDGYWSTASEALGDFLVSLNNIRNTLANDLSQESIKKLDLAIQQIKEAFNKSNNPQ